MGSVSESVKKGKSFSRCLMKFQNSARVKANVKQHKIEEPCGCSLQNFHKRVGIKGFMICELRFPLLGDGGGGVCPTSQKFAHSPLPSSRLSPPTNFYPPPTKCQFTPH